MLTDIAANFSVAQSEFFPVFVEAYEAQIGNTQGSYRIPHSHTLDRDIEGCQIALRFVLERLMGDDSSILAIPLVIPWHTIHLVSSGLFEQYSVLQGASYSRSLDPVGSPSL